MQRRKLAQKYGHEFLALLDRERKFKVFVTDIVQKLVFQDDEGNDISQTDSSFVGKIIEVRLIHYTEGVVKQASLRTALGVDILLNPCVNPLPSMGEGRLKLDSS